MRDDDNQFSDDQFDAKQSDDENQLEALRSATRRRTVCRHSFRKVGTRRICKKCGLKVSGGRPSVG